MFIFLLFIDFIAISNEHLNLEHFSVICFLLIKEHKQTTIIVSYRLPLSISFFLTNYVLNLCKALLCYFSFLQALGPSYNGTRISPLPERILLLPTCGERGTSHIMEESVVVFI